MAVSLICWALWSYDRQSDMLGFVDVWLSLSLFIVYVALWSYGRQSDMLGFVVV